MKIIDSITLGATIRARRKELGYTQSDLQNLLDSVLVLFLT